MLIFRAWFTCGKTYKKFMGSNKYLISIERFHSRGHHLCKFIGTKENFRIRKESNSHRIGLGHQHGRRFIVWSHQHGRRFIVWSHQYGRRHVIIFWWAVLKLLRTSNNTLYPALTASFTADRDDILLADEIVPAPPWTMMQGLNEGFLWAVISAFFFGLEDLGTRTDCFSRWRRILFKSTIRKFSTVLTLPCA